MRAKKTAEIYIESMGSSGWCPRNPIRAEREKGSDFIDLTLPAGSRTKQTITLRLRESELRALVVWLQE